MITLAEPMGAGAPPDVVSEAAASDYRTKSRAYFEQTRRDVLPLLPAPVGRVLEVGCGTGATLAALRRERGATFTAGLDVHAPSVEIARARADFAAVWDIEAEPPPAELGSFDAILLLDVLEHLRDPWSVVRMLSRRLHPGGLMIVSVPNIRYYAISLRLVLKGDWTLTDAGILDRTHLRFFVRRTALDLVATDLLRAVEVRCIGPRAGTKADLFRKMSLGLLPDLFAQQFVIKAERHVV